MYQPPPDSVHHRDSVHVSPHAATGDSLQSPLQVTPAVQHIDTPIAPSVPSVQLPQTNISTTDSHPQQPPTPQQSPTPTAPQQPQTVPQTVAGQTEPTTPTFAEDHGAHQSDAYVPYSYILAPTEEGEVTYSDGTCFDFNALFGVEKNTNDTVVTNNDTLAVAEQVVYRPSIFAHHSLQLVHSEPLPRQVSASHLHITISVAVLFVLLCIYYKVHGLKFLHAVSALFSTRLFDAVQREANLVRRSSFVPCLFFFAASVGVYVGAVRHFLHMPSVGMGEWQLILVVAGASVLAFGLRNIAILLLGRVFDCAEATDRYILQGYMIQLVVTSVMLPIIFFLCFSYMNGTTSVVIISLPLIIGFIYNLISAIRIFFVAAKASYFFLFYYLCTLEIVPLLILLKYFILL